MMTSVPDGCAPRGRLRCCWRRWPCTCLRRPGWGLPVGRLPHCWRKGIGSPAIELPAGVPPVRFGGPEALEIATRSGVRSFDVELAVATRPSGRAG